MNIAALLIRGETEEITWENVFWLEEERVREVRAEVSVEGAEERRKLVSVQAERARPKNCRVGGGDHRGAPE